jgi:hypothetical protein
MKQDQIIRKSNEIFGKETASLIHSICTELWDKFMFLGKSEIANNDWPSHNSHLQMIAQDQAGSQRPWCP